jgi:hypothetical protein
MSVCKWCGVHPCTWEHRKAHREVEKRLLDRLERTNPTGEARVFLDLSRRRIAFDEDLAAGKMTHEEFERRWDEIQRDSAAYLKANAS